MAQLSISILGGTGFVGSHLCARLAREGHLLKVLARHCERHRDLQVLPGLTLVEADIFDPMMLREQLRGCDVVINLVGILNEKENDGRGFRRIHVELPALVVAACHEVGVERLLHMSALGADAQSGPSHYLRTKGEGEALVHTSGLQVTTFRPSVIFGRGDSLFTRFAKLLRRTPWIFPLACPDARFQPVFVGDVVEVIAQSITRHATFGQSYELCGPRVYTLQQLVEYTTHLLHLRRLIVPLNDPLSRLQARLLQYFPGKPFSMDNYLSMQQNSVCDRPWPSFFKVTPASIESIVPGYLAKGHR